ncbi:MAG: SUMF1/EgtB/PvdO family nonheme iron enzyme [Deltaproteobacteria bacterium]|jgi:formylglycine-generating enzyme required for sulfatase activity|nr:SUMF1/EgtB/PvdO family nonheme iron enzyme [Deltaproteobacteria bacterium]MBW2536805.1 SUMF1/EgtB/PvdO family nonheme iron enzyme [Deltaproteobacteria bacterium]
MKKLPARTIAAWTATFREKKLFGLDCKARPEACHQPQRTIGAFCIDQAEVTAGAYRLCVQAGRCTTTHLDCGPAATYGHADRPTFPINCVDHGQAAAYCRALGKRLPTREEYGWAQSSGAYDGNGHLTPPWGGRYPNPDEAWASIGPAPLAGPGPVDGRPKGRTKQGVAGLFGNVREWSAPYASSDGSMVVAWLGYSYETTRKTPIGAGSSTKAAAEAYDTATGFRCAAGPAAAKAD